MKARNEFLIKSMVPVLAFALCGMPELVQAQEAAHRLRSHRTEGTTVDPSKGPLAPIPTQNAPEQPRTVYPGQDNDLTPTPQPATPPPQTLAEPQTATAGRRHG